jgi:signal transduction histidine kinase
VAVVEAVEVPVSVAVVAEVVVVVAVVVVVVVEVVSAPAQLNTQDRRKAERRQSTLVPLPSMRSCPYWLRPILHLLLHPLRR